MTRSSAWLSVCAVFLSGLSIGALGMHLYESRSPGGDPPRPTERHRGRFMARHLAETLELTPEQEARIAEIREDSHHRSEEFRRSLRPELEQHMRRTREQIRDVLTPDQQTTFDALVEEQGRRMERYLLGEGHGRRGARRGRGGPPPDPVADP